MHRRTLTLLAGGTAAAFALAMPLRALPPGTTTDKAAPETVTKACTGGNTLSVYAPASLWPPNHKYNTTLYVLAVDRTVDQDPDTPEGNVKVESHGYHDQYDSEHEELKGSGTPNETPGDDITVNDDEETVQATAGTNGDGNPQMLATETGAGTVKTHWMARAERSGQDADGREYTLGATATFSDGSTCTHTVEFRVPHDMRKSTRTG